MLDKHIGKKVRILEHYNDIVDDFINITQVYATKDSIGVILSYEEYRAHYEVIYNLENLHEKDIEKRSSKDPVLRNAIQDPHLRHLAWVKSAMSAGTNCPIRFEQFVPLPERDYAKLKQEYLVVDVVCKVGAVIILPTYTFVFVERTI